MLHSAGATYTRVAVVQLAYHPAALVDRRSPLEDPLFDPRGGPDSLLPAKGEVPDALAPDLAALRTRIRNAHNDQLLAKLRAALAACQSWGARVVVLPEYSVPWEILGGVADAAGDMVVVAGTHAVDRDARRSGVYERLVAPAVPAFGQAVCPVLHRGRIIALQPKLHPAVPERGSMKAGERWEPITMPDGLPGPLGVLVCLDFLYRESEAHTKLVAGPLGQCRFLAVPSLTPHYTLPEFAGKAWEEARRYGRPVLYCDSAEGGGTSIYVDEGQAYDLRRFPDRAGYLEPGDEGVIVADVNLGFERAGGSTRYGGVKAVVPVAEATFVYTAHPAGKAYAEWLEGVKELLAREDDEAVEELDARVKKGREVLLNAGALTGAAARGRRLKKLLAEIDKVTRVEEVRQFTREVVLPESVLPLGEVRRGMAAGAADAVFGWMKRAEARAAGFGEVEARLREAGKGAAVWAGEVVGRIADAVKGVVDEEKPATVEAPVRVVLPEGVDPAALGVQRHGGWVLTFRARPIDFWVAVVPSHKPAPAGTLFGSIDDARRAVDLYDLAVAQGADRIAVVSAMPDNHYAAPLHFIASSRQDKWALWPVGKAIDTLGNEAAAHMLSSFVASGLYAPVLVPLRALALSASIVELAPVFHGAALVVRALREQRLREVGGQFVEPDALVASDKRRPVLEALDGWLVSSAQTALVLGEFGTGKSTVLAEWAHRRWEQGDARLQLLVNLAGVGPHASPEALLLHAAGLDDLPKHRAALRLLIRHRLLIPCFDGFDEMATRLEGAELAGRLSALIEVAADGGKVLISSRTNYFPTREHLRTAADAALAQALGASAGLLRIELQPFSDEQVKALVRKIRTEAGEAERALDRIAGIYDLRDLVHRPLLLGMVLSTLDTLDTGKRIGRADLYEAYLGRWLDQTRKDDPECFTDAQKMAFAEALAEELWRSGEASCTWQALQKSVRMRLVPELREGVPVGAALLEMQGGAFFVHEGEDRYRFAHKSFLEYFLARVLVTTLPERPAEVLATKPITREVAEFVGEILRRKGDPHEARAVKAVSAWLSGSAGTTPVAAANALRLLLELSRWAGDGKAWIPTRADLRRVVLVKEDLRGAQLVRADLSGADLSGADLSEADLSGACLVGTMCVGVKLATTKLAGVNGSGANFTLVEADGVDLSGAVLDGAVLRQSMWTGCRWHDVRAEGAEVTGWAAPGAAGAFAEGTSLSALSQAMFPALAAGHDRYHPIKAVAWSPDCTRLASGGPDNTLRLWDVASGDELAQFGGHSLKGYIGEIETVAWSPDGLRLMSGGPATTSQMWDAASGQEIARLQGHAGSFGPVAWSHDGTRVVSGGGDKTVRVWDAASGNEAAKFESRTSRVEVVAWSPDGERLVIGGDDHTLQLWDAASGTEIAKLEGHSQKVTVVAWSPDGTRLVSGGHDYTLRMWDAVSGDELAKLGKRVTPVGAVAWSPDGTCLVSGENDDRTVRLWDAASAKELKRLVGHAERVYAVGWSPDGTRIVSGGYDNTLRIWDVNAGNELARFEGRAKRVYAVAWSPDGTRLVSGGFVSRLWDAASGREIVRLRGRPDADVIWGMAWSPDSARLVSVGYDGVVRLWDVASGDETAQSRGYRGVIEVAWPPSGPRLASVEEGGVVLWDAASGNELATLRGRVASVRTVAWSPDGTRLVTGGDDDAIRLWDVASGNEIARIEGKGARSKTVAWSPDGARLVGGGFFGPVRLWDVASGRELARLEGHTSLVAAVGWSPDGARIASRGYDHTIRLWDANSGDELARFEEYTARVAAVSWSPDGTRLLSAGDDGTLRIWDATRFCLLASLEAAGPSTLTRTRGGFCLINDTPAVPARLALRRPEPGSGTVLYLPLAGLRRVLHRPDKVRAALAGDLSGDDIRPELERLGWTNGVPWDGKAHRVPRIGATVSEVVGAAATSASVGWLGGGALIPPQNPFSPGPALTGELPPGRGLVLLEILSLLLKKRPAPVILRGPRRSGKTSILHCLQHRVATTHHIRLIPLEGRSTPVVTADDLARLVDPSLAAGASPADTLRKRLQRRRAKRTLLLLDEVANLSSADASLFAWLRALGQEGTGVLLAGSHWDWVRIVERAAAIMPGSSFGNDVTPVTLGPLREEDALQFLVDTAPADVPLARDGTARWILDRCGPWPFYLQVMGFSIVQAVRQGERKALVERVGVDDLYEQRLLLDRNDGYFKTRFGELPVRARALLDSLRTRPPGDRPVYRDLPPEDRLALTDTGLCTALGAWLEDRPFFDWIVRVKDEGRR